MSDELVKRNRIQLSRLYGIRTGPGIENLFRASYLSAIIQALFTCEEFRVKILVIALHFAEEPTLIMHANIARLFKHMISGKEAFLIPGNVQSLLVGIEQNAEQNPKDFMEFLLQTLYMNYTNFLRSNQIQLPNSSASEAFCGLFRWDCEACRESKFFNSGFGKSIWTTTLDVTQTMNQFHQVSLQREINLFGNRGFYLNNNPCTRCRRHNTIKINWIKPSVLIIELRPQRENMVRVEEWITVDTERYDLIACVCYETPMQQYSCFAKFAKNWFYYKNRVAKELPEMLPYVGNVCIIFYKKKRQTIPLDVLSNYLESKQAVTPVVLTVENKDHMEPSIAGAEFLPHDYPAIGAANKVNLQTGLMRAFINIEEEICFINATLQALLHCNLFRDYISQAGNENLGPFHQMLKFLTMSMDLGNREHMIMFHQHFVNLFTQVNPNCPRSDHSFFAQLMDNLNAEVVEFEHMQGIGGGRQTSFAIQVRDKDYANIGIGREDLSSSDAWIQYLIEQHNTALVNMFTIQEMSSERCCYRDKSYLKFDHTYMRYLAIEVSSRFNSLQNLVDFYDSPLFMPKETKVCSKCAYYDGDQSSQLYLYSSISRSSNILVFFFGQWDQKQNFVTIDTHVDECLIVCDEFYYCMAFTVYDYRRPHRVDHTYTYTRRDDNQWWLYDDLTVRHIGPQMPNNNYLHRISRNANIYLVFYEKKANISAMSMRQIPDATALISPLQLKPNSPPKQLSMQASIMPLSGITSSMNAALQCLYHCLQFRKYIIFDQQIGGDARQTHTLLKWLFVNMSISNLNTIDGQPFGNNFIAKHPNIGKEPKRFLTMVFRDLQNELVANDAINENTGNPLHNMFSVIYSMNTVCPIGHNQQINFKPEYILVLNMDGSNHQDIQTIIHNEIVRHTQTETNCRCNHCGSNAKQRAHVFRVPNILVIQLAIFGYDKSEGKRTKLGQSVRVNDLIEVMDETYVFRACICCGTSMHSNNYTAYAKCGDGFYCFDGIDVRTNRVMHKLNNVYILFYEKY